MQSSPIQIFEYLLALKNLTVPVVRNIPGYKDKYWWQSEFPLHDGCPFYGDTKDPDAWLEVYKQTIDPSPKPPDELQEWVIDKGTEPDRPPQVHETISKLTPEEKEQLTILARRIAELEKQITGIEEADNRSKLEMDLLSARNKEKVLQDKNEIFFAADPHRVALWHQWLNEVWQPWADITLPKLKVQQIYGAFFALYQRLQREGDATELVWGHGLLTWYTDNLKISRPVLTTRMELLFDSKNGVFKLLPTSNGTILELDMLSNIELPNSAHLISAERFIQENGIHPWDEAVTVPFFEELIHALSPNGNVEYSVQSGRNVNVENTPVIYNAPVLFIRSRSGRQWQNELNGIIEPIRNGQFVPETIQSLVSLAVTESAAGNDGQAAGQPEWSALGKELLFPLPANNEQKEIIRRLSRNIGVVVQGPPGTGKSHTIVNLIAHLLAHGKRVLVTSQTERALRVLGDMIRLKLPEIAPLCVSVTGGDARSVQELDLAVSKISEGLDLMNIEVLTSEIEQLRQDLFDCKRNLAKLKTELGRATEAEHITAAFAGQEFSPLQLADWTATHQEDYGWLPDDIAETSEIPLSDRELVRLFQLLGELAPTEIDQVLQSRPAWEALPAAEEVVDLTSRLQEFKEGNRLREEKIKGWTFSPNADRKITEYLASTEKAIQALSLQSEEWLVKILDDIVHGHNRSEYWQTLVTDCREKIQEIRNFENQISEFSFEAPAHFDIRKVKEDAELLLTELRKNGKPGFAFKMFSGRKTLYILEQFKINGSMLRTAEDVAALITHLHILAAKQRLALKWTNSTKIIDAPAVTPDESRLLPILDKYIELIEVSFTWKSEHLQTLNRITGDIKPYGVLDWINPEWLFAFKDGLIAYQELLEYKKLNQQFESFSLTLKKGLAVETAHASWGTLYEAYRLGNGSKWRETLIHLKRLQSLEPQVKELLSLKDKLSACAPRWLAQIEAEARSTDGPIEPPAAWREAWEWKRAQAWLKKHFQRYNLEELYEQLHRARDGEAGIIQTLVSKSTWLEQNRRTTDIQRRSLRSWVQTIRRIGKGTGKYAARHQADAKKEMAICRGAVPVWIMPLNRVIENLQLSNDRFDVVIVDESSQCDLFALTALFRAERAVIVGDDRQISPEGVGRDQTEVYKLIDRHLIQVPQRERFTLQDSLYDTCLRVFPGQQIMLKEHFRCVPEIIQFSNDQFYGGAIEPLKVPTTDRLTPPIVTVRVEDGYREEGTSAVNKPEALALVDNIVELCANKDYSNKTMGVISLQGKDQAYEIEQCLREKLGESEMMERRLICGDAYSFQGDERDVMFLSMVAAPNVQNGVLSKRSDEQRFNVAASRAKEQLWLFHSLDLNQLNPGCMRYRLLQYCLDPKRTQCAMEDAEEAFKRYGSSQFHREVHKMIVARGYRAIPEFKVGTHPYRIDTVIEGMNARIAVECDGDTWHGMDQWEADLERQMILERVGWKFWRVRGSTFYRDKNKAMEPLWDLLVSLGIEPVKQSI
ncbi:Hypothetical protein LUCI_2441 [Lucifera butyrica]|uniref:Uncharacterized protein n=1 Tax=Lucifera butyrica TaxID=1351585 RepID=A0A498R8E9_9FIRM|nr:AAA domain-containing protein [Lucifera butyrica]VBB07197.1 Hypothetical protein LUCI_2441 [Lucifera butyrica]